MALDNIFREPRRELTESIVGILFLLAVVYGDYRFGVWFASKVVPANQAPFIMLGMLLGAVGLFLVWVLTHITHWIGESICDVLARRGLELRPKNRY